MGELLEQYRALIQKRESIKTSAEPDKGKQPKEWIAWKEEQNLKKNIEDNIRKTIQSPNLTEEGWRIVFETAFGKNAAKKFVDDAWEGYRIPMEFHSYLVTNNPKVIEELNKEDRKKYDDGDAQFRRAFYERLIRDKVIPKDFVDKTWQGTYKAFIASANDLKRQNIVNAFEKCLNKEQQEEISKGFSTDFDVLKKQDSERIDYPYSKKCEEIKKNIPQYILKDPEKKKAYEDALDFASKNLMVTKDSYLNALTEREHAYETLDVPHTDAVVAEKKDTYRDGKYNKMYEPEQKLCGHKKFRLIKQENRDLLNEFNNEKISLSDKTKEGMKLILKKMEQMKLHTYSLNTSGEDGNKIYGFSKLMKKREALMDALDAKDKNPDIIIKTSREYEESVKEMEELYKIAREYFSPEQYFFQPNLDSVRNANIPVTFTRDFTATAQINGLFLAHKSIAQNGMSIEEYVENPTKATLDKGLKYYEDKSFANFTKDLDFDDCVDLLFRRNKFSYTSRDYTRGGTIAGILRSLQAPNYLESDKKLQDNNLVYGDMLHNHVLNMAMLEGEKYDYLAEATNSEELKLSRIKTFQNLLVVADNDRNLNAMFGDFPETTKEGLILNPPFDLKHYINTHRIDYDTVTERAGLLRYKHENSNSNVMEADDIQEAIMNSYQMILVANQKDRGTPGFDSMEAEYLQGLSKLTVDTGLLPDFHLYGIRQRLEKQVKDYKTNYRPDLRNAELLSEIAAADENVHNGSKAYDRAWDAVKEVDQLFKRYHSLDNDYSNKEKHRVLADLRLKVAEAGVLIEAYINRKLGDGTTIAQLDAKGQRRVRIMQETKEAYGRFDIALLKMDNMLRSQDNERIDRYQAALNEVEEESLPHSDYDLYEDPYDFGGKTRSEQLEIMYGKLKDVDPSSLHSHKEFREFREAFEAFKKYGDSLSGELSRKEMDTYLKLAIDVKEKAKAYQDKKQADKVEYRTRNNGRELRYKPVTTNRINLAGEMIKMVDEHLTYSCGKKYLKEVGGNPEERALARWAMMVREEERYRSYNIYAVDENKITSTILPSLAKSMCLEKLKIKFETDSNYTAEQFEADMTGQRFKDNCNEIVKLLNLKGVGVSKHLKERIAEKQKIDFEEIYVEGIVNPDNYKYLIKADPRFSKGQEVTEGDLKDLKFLDHKYVCAEIRYLCSKILLYSNGKYSEQYNNVLKDFGFEAYEHVNDDGSISRKLKQEIHYKGELIQPDEEIYVKTETMDYSKLSDEELTDKIHQLEEKNREYSKLVKINAKNANDALLREIGSYVDQRMKFSKVRKAEVSIGLSKDRLDRESAIEKEFSRRSDTYDEMRKEVRQELEKAREVANQREQERQYYEGRRNVAENLKPGDVIRVDINDVTVYELEVLGVEEGVIYFDDFGAASGNEAFLQPHREERVYNKGGMTIDEFVHNPKIQYTPETYRSGAENKAKKRPYTGPIVREEFKEIKIKDREKEVKAYLDSEKYRMANNQVIRNLRERYFLQENEEYAKKLRGHEMKDFAKKLTEEFNKRVAARKDLANEKDPNKLAEEKARILVESKAKLIADINKLVDEAMAKKEEEFIKLAARKDFKDSYGKKYDLMNDYPSRFAQAKELYAAPKLVQGVDFEGDNEIDIENEIENEIDSLEIDTGSNKKEIKNENKIENEIKNENKIENEIKNENKIENKIKNEIKNENKNEIENEIKNEIIFSREDRVRESWWGRVRELESEILVITKEKKALKDQGITEEKDSPRLVELNNKLTDLALEIVYQGIVRKQFETKKIDTEQFSLCIRSYHKEKAQKEFNEAMESVPGFKNKFIENLKPFRRTNEIFDNICGKKDTIIAQITVDMDKKTAEIHMNKLAGDKKFIQDKWNEILAERNKGLEGPKGNKGAKGNEGPKGNKPPVIKPPVMK